MSNYLSKLNKKSEKNPLKLFLCCFLITIILFSAIKINELNTEETDTKNNYPNLSANEIIISTPENITYTEPMSGYYPATYGFENDPDGSFPSGMINKGTYPISVSGSMFGHNKVLWLDDNGYSYRASCQNNFSRNINNGTIEFWFLVDDTYDRTGIIIERDTANLVNFGSRYDKWKYSTSIEEDLNIQKATGGDMDSPLDNTWNHVRLDFEATTGNYMGLDQFTWKCWINGIESAVMPFFGNEPYADNFFMSTSNAHTSYNLFIDAIGFSWDENYNIGDNLNEGLLLSYRNNTRLDWQGYSLDGQANRTILGNKTIPMPADGSHFIQVFGNNSVGVMNASVIRYFTVETYVEPPIPYINVITPENRTYTELMSGYYPATYGFENDADGSDAQGWEDASSYGQIIEVISDFQGHNKVVRGYDNADPGAWNYRHYFSNTQGSIEFWWAISSIASGKEHQVAVRSFGEEIFAIRCYGGQIGIYTSGGWFNIPGLITTANTWDHVRIDFRSSTGSSYEGLNQNEFKIYYNGVEYGPYAFYVNGDPEYLRLYSGGVVTGVYGYYDGIGFSWDENYNIGDNLNEGLLLSYRNNTRLDWQGYSLDGQANRTILGNKTIPMPADGSHFIQVFGNNSVGVMNASVIRYFTVETYVEPPIPYITIITPENRTYTEPMSGYYPATYGFEGDLEGTFPSYMINDGTHPVSVYLSENGHNKVLWLDDNGYSYQAACYNNFADSKDNGTIEFWFLIDDAYDRVGIQIRRDVDLATNLVSTGSRYGLWRYDDGVTSDLVIQQATGGNMPGPLDNTWHHIKIAFECTSGNYMGLDQFTWKCWIDGIESAAMPFYSDEPYANIFRMATSNAHTSYNVYIDAIGYSWDPNYTIGDNLNEGLLLSYRNNTRLDWQGYSLDGQANRTILGNKTIPMPADGSHFIQVFGNNSVGVMNASVIRYFTAETHVEPPIPYITVITPENRTYTDPISDLFLSFKTNINLDWIAYSLDGRTNITIMGNTTILMPVDGFHTIQIFGNNTLGIIYESNIRYFTIDTSPPIISGIEFIIELEQYSYYQLLWDIIDISGGTYTILKNSSIESSGSFQNNDEISIIIGTSKLGYLNYTLIAKDLFGKISSHTVIVKIIRREQEDPIIPGFNILILFTVVLMTIGIIIKFKFKNKKYFFFNYI